MDLILWRHAEAELGIPDEARVLTAKGNIQAKKMAHWLDARVPRSAEMLVSPALRAQQTANALLREFEMTDAVGIGASASQIIQAIEWSHNDRTVIVVGHQPTLGEVAAMLLTGKLTDFHVKKGAVWWLRSRLVDDELSAVLHAVITPALL